MYFEFKEKFYLIKMKDVILKVKWKHWQPLILSIMILSGLFVYVKYKYFTDEVAIVSKGQHFSNPVYEGNTPVRERSRSRSRSRTSIRRRSSSDFDYTDDA